ncbi:MAG: 5'-nucleotidase C-terminal domain-containing protein [Bacteroidaceae bacterium]|nr:5'-nucleotidase C-terminal domain-containing protein [Bacteroidaceae bacterium]
MTTLAQYKSKVDSIVTPALGLSRKAMSAGKPESLLGNWIADVIVEGGTATGLEAADIGLVNIGSLRGEMPDGIITKGNIMQISPFDNYIVVLEMRGKDMIELMHEIAAVGGEAVSSSIRMEISPDGKLLSCTIDGKEIDPRRIYKVATIDYLAEGNDGMTALKKAVKRHDLGILTRDIMSEYVIKHRVMDSHIEGRIKIKEQISE